MDFNQMVSEVNSLLQTYKNQTDLNREVFISRRIEDNYHTNAIEGSTLSFDETSKLLSGEGVTGRHATHFLHEIVGYQEAQDIIISQYRREKPLTLDFIKKLNRCLTKGTLGEEAGDLRTAGYDVRAGFKDVGYSKGKDVEAKMSNFIDRWNTTFFSESTGLANDFIAALILKQIFIMIHPFRDGNGRISRLLINYYLLMKGLMPFIINVQDRRVYIDSLNASRNGKEIIFISEMLKIYHRELNEYVKYIRGNFI